MEIINHVQIVHIVFFVTITLNHRFTLTGVIRNR